MVRAAADNSMTPPEEAPSRGDLVAAMSLERKRPPHWKEKDPQVISAQQMRRGVGYLAILLPVVAAVGYGVFGQEYGGFLGSISESYYTVMRDVFVGTLCAVAFFSTHTKAIANSRIVSSMCLAGSAS